MVVADHGDANDPNLCIEMMKKKRVTPVHLSCTKVPTTALWKTPVPHVFMGWHLSYDPNAEKDMMQRIISALKTKKFVKGIESR
jgi:hypothetical protein